MMMLSKIVGFVAGFFGAVWARVREEKEDWATMFHFLSGGDFED